MLATKYLFLLLPLLGSTITFNDVPPFSKLQWLLGTWQQKKGKDVTYESWQKLNDSTFYSKSFYIKGTDTVMLEVVSLEMRMGKLSYVVTTANQNNAQPVSFVCNSDNPEHLVFENPEHDFPTRITYNYKAPDSLKAEISGKIKEKPVTRHFPMSRISNH